MYLAMVSGYSITMVIYHILLPLLAMQKSDGLNCMGYKFAHQKLYVLNCRQQKYLPKVLQNIVACTAVGYKWSINPFTTPYPVYSHT
jgi:hypothetical protein